MAALFDIILEIKDLDENHAKLLKNKKTYSINRESIYKAVDNLPSILFPSLYRDTELESLSKLDCFQSNLTTEIAKALYFDEDIEVEKAVAEANEIMQKFLAKFPVILKVLYTDLEAIYNGDPAASSRTEIIYSFLPFKAIMIYRFAHELYVLNVPLIPRIMGEYAHAKTGIDINAGAEIGKAFCIDHGTGIVIGETARVGENVRIYQGVTLGALSLEEGRKLQGKKRHPDIEDDVIIYANATILGGDTVIGKGSVIGGGTFITKSVPENTQVFLDAKALPLKESKHKD